MAGGNIYVLRRCVIRVQVSLRYLPPALVGDVEVCRDIINCHIYVDPPTVITSVTLENGSHLSGAIAIKVSSSNGDLLLAPQCKPSLFIVAYPVKALVRPFHHQHV